MWKFLITIIWIIKDAKNGNVVCSRIWFIAFYLFLSGNALICPAIAIIPAVVRTHHHHQLFCYINALHENINTERLLSTPNRKKKVRFCKKIFRIYGTLYTVYIAILKYLNTVT